MKVLRVLLLVSTLVPGFAGQASAGEGGSDTQDFGAPSADDPPAIDDDRPELPPWQRPGAIGPELGVDDDPTPFNPAEGPSAPDPY